MDHRLRSVLRRWAARVFARLYRRGIYRLLAREAHRPRELGLALNLTAGGVLVGSGALSKLDPRSVGRILVLAPHSDDEAIGPGGTLLLASASGAELHVAYVTDSGNFPCPFASTRQEVVNVRAAEAAAGCALIGATMWDIGINCSSVELDSSHVEKLTALIDSIKPDVVLAPWLLDSSAQHRLANQLLYGAMLASEHRPQQYWGYQVHGAIPANGIVDITSVSEMKRGLLRCYRSQLQYYKAYDHIALGMNAWNSHHLGGASPSYAELFLVLSIEEFGKLVQRLYLPNLRAVYGDRPEVLIAAQRLAEMTES